VPLSLKR